MVDKTDKQAADQPKADEPKVEEPKVEEPKAEEPKVEEPQEAQPEPAQDTPAPAGDGDQAAGTDQHGRQLFDVTCSSCGNKAQVPFKPSGDRPVYCRECYMKQGNDRRGGGRDNRGPKRF